MGKLKLWGIILTAFTAVIAAAKAILKFITCVEKLKKA